MHAFILSSNFLTFLNLIFLFFFFFNDTATTEIYTLSLHDALPISATVAKVRRAYFWGPLVYLTATGLAFVRPDRKSTRLNSSHGYISYAVFCLKKKKQKTHNVAGLTESKT